MPVISCPFPDCRYTTDDIDAVVAAAQLNIHALTHRNTPAATKQKPPKIDRPHLTRGTTEEEWNTFVKRWNLFKQGTDIPNGQVATQLWQCCEADLENDLFKDIDDIRTVDEANLLAAMKRLAVISTATSVRKTELLTMRQDHGQPIRSFAAQVKGKAQVCSFSKTCRCAQVVDYTEDIVKYVVISGIVDEEIKRDILGHPDLDEKSLNNTISLIENKEMASRAMTTSVSLNDLAGISNSTPRKVPTKEGESKLSIKISCKSCSKPINQFKLRRGKFREFTHCIACWRKIHNVPPSNYSTMENTGAIFDTLSSLTNKTDSPARKTVSLNHHIFDGTYGWMMKESQKQPTVTLKISTSDQDYEHFSATKPSIKPRKLSVITDTGAQSSLMGLKPFMKCGFKRSDLLPVSKKMLAANNEGINILGAVFIRLSATDTVGRQLTASEMVYVSGSTDLFYLSRNGMQQLRIISPQFPVVGEAASVTDKVQDESKVTDDAPMVNPSDKSTVIDMQCTCPKRQQPPPRPTHLPFAPSEENIPLMKQWLLDRYAGSTFNRCPHQPLPMMSGPPIHIHMDPNATPVAVHTPAPIPLHWRKQIKDQLDADVALGVIEKVEPNVPTTWCHRAIWVRKPDGNPRRVVDFQSLNKHCLRDTHHTVPPFQQAKTIPHSTYRSVTDAWNGYHSVPVRKEDRHLLVFITEFGRYRYCVAPQGYLASGDGYTHRYDKIIADIPRKTKCVDDTAMWDDAIEPHWWRMIDFLDLIAKEGIILNPSKFQFCEKTIDFAGFQITPSEVKPLPKYLESILLFPRPKSIRDIRAWFGLINQVSHYGQLSRIMEPFKPLLSPKTIFKWTDELETSFQQSKTELIKAIKNGVRIFDPSRKTCLNPDWSKTGIGYWLRQKYCSCESNIPDCCGSGWVVTLAGSRFLKTAETRYAPIEGEALAIAWALEDTKYFTLGCDDLVITTDHKPLVRIFGDRSLDEISNPRIFRLKQRTLAWMFNVFHVPGKSIPASDTTSRNPAASTQDTAAPEWLNDKTVDHLHSIEEMEMESDVIASVRSTLNKVSAVTWDRVKQMTLRDHTLQQLKTYIINSFPLSADTLPPELLPYWRYRHELSIVDEVILVGDRILIPPPLRSEVCKLLHAAHQGTTAMNERAKSSVFWPGITSCISRTREQCDTCWRMAPSQPHLPPILPTAPTYPFQAIASDYCDLGGNHYLITVDRFSNWPEVTKVIKNSANSGASGLIKALKRFFATFGVAEELSSDGGPEFTAGETEDFLQRWGVSHRQSSAYHPRSNGRAEVAVKSMKRLLSDNIDASGNLDTDVFTQAILQFRNTPDPANNMSPAQVIFGRPLRDALPFLPTSQIHVNPHIRPVWKDLWNKREETLHTRFVKQVEALKTRSKDLLPLHVGDCCRIQNQHGRFPKKWDKTGHVVQVNGHDQYMIKVDGTGRITLRNRKFLRRIEPFMCNKAAPLPTPPCPSDVVEYPPPSPSRPSDVVEYPPPSPSRPSDVVEYPNRQDEPQPPATTNDCTDTTVVAERDEVIQDTATPDESQAFENSQSDNVTVSRRSLRVRKPPVWHKDFEL